MITVEEKMKGLEHVFYEIYMLFYCAENISTKMGWQINSCIIESFAIHLRALRDFFEKSRKDARKTDIVAEDYGSFTKYNKQIRIGNDPGIFNQPIDDALDKEIAHISYNRLNSKTN